MDYWLALSYSLTSLGFLLLIWAALHDLAARTVPNAMATAILVTGVCVRLIDHDVIPGVIIAFAVFVALFVIWLFGAIGGGDVKLWSASVMLVPTHWGTELSCITRILLAGGVLGLIYLSLRLLVKRPRASRAGGRLARILRAEAWRISRKAPLPYAVAIASGTIATLLPLPLPMIALR